MGKGKSSGSGLCFACRSRGATTRGVGLTCGAVLDKCGCMSPPGVRAEDFE